MIEQILKMETCEKFFINGVFGNPYEFNIHLFNGEYGTLSRLFCENYSGVYMLTRYSVSAGNSYHELLYCGISSDISKTLKEFECNKRLSSAGANCFCYYYEPSELVRNDVFFDLSSANSFLYT